MLKRKSLFCLLVLAAWQSTAGAKLPVQAIGREQVWESTQQLSDNETGYVEPPRARVSEGVPPPLCAGRVCAAPPAGPVCAFDATGTARTFKTICELEAVSCRESTLYAITSIGEC